MPTISIITAAYNASATIADCLQSIASQTHLAEHIIIDGASTDATLEISRRISPHSRILSEPDQGIYDAMNKGISLATGEVIGLLNADDFYASPQVLAKVAKVFEDPAVMSCYGDLEYVRETGSRSEIPAATEINVLLPDVSTAKLDEFKVHRYWKSGEFSPDRFYWGWMPPHPTFFVRRAVYEQHGLFNPELGSAADYELMLRLLVKEHITTAYIPEVLVRMRVGGVSNRTLAARLAANRMDRKAWVVNGITPYPWTILMKPLRKLPQWLKADSSPTSQ